MASVRKVPSGAWEVRWKNPDGESRKKRFKTKAGARQFKTEVEHQVLSHTYVDPGAGKVSFQDYAEAWRAIQAHRPGTASQIRINLEKHVYPRLGHRPLGAIRRSEIQALVADLNQSLAPTTVEVVVAWVRTVFKCAVTDRKIPASPCVDIKLAVVEKPRVLPLPHKKVEALINAVPDRYRALIVMGAGTGVRISEALAVTQDRIDWFRRYVTIDRQLTRAKGSDPVFGPVKDRRNRGRTIPIPAVVHEALAWHVQVYGTGPLGLLFTTEKGERIRQTSFSDIWRRAAAPLGIPTGEGFHLLRHYYASVLIDAGESVKVVQDRLGHTSAQMTLDIYGHLWPENDDTTRAAVDRAFGAAGVHLGSITEASGE